MSYQIIKPNFISEFLNKEIFKTKFITFDFWMLVHLFTGGLLALFFDLNEWNKVLALLIAYEVFEVALWGVAFRPEEYYNIFWDIVIGMLGFYIINFVRL